MKAHGVRRTADRRGAALVLALWILLVLGMASLQILAEVRGRLDSVALARAETVGRYAAESGVVAAEALLDELVGSAASPAHQALIFAELQGTLASWGEVSLGTGRYQIVAEDLNARVDLNRSRPAVLEGLIARFVPPGRAASLVRTLRGDFFGDEEPAQGTSRVPEEEDDPMVSALPSTAPPLMHLEELARLPGFGDSLTASLAPYVTVSSDGMINANSAPEAVLAAIPYVGSVRARALIAERERSGPLPSDVAVYSALAEGGVSGVDPQLPDLVTAPRRVLVVARGWEVGHPYTHEVQAVFEILASSLVEGSRVRLRGWTERMR